MRFSIDSTHMHVTPLLLVALVFTCICVVLCGCATSESEQPAEQPAELTNPEPAVVEQCGPVLTKLPNKVGSINFAKWHKRNSDMIGWVKIKGTNVNNVVMLSKDNDDYLHKDPDGNNSVAGTIFMDYENDRWLRDYNTILYGHHMADGTMFRDIARYIDPKYLKAHSKITYINRAGVHKLKPFYCWAAQANVDMNRVDFKNVKQFRKYWKKRLKGKKLYNGVKISELDHIFTFYTCSYQGEDFRTVLLAAEY